MKNEKDKAQAIFNWVANTQFNLIFNSEGIPIPMHMLTEQIRYRAISYVKFYFDTFNNFDNLDIPNIGYWNAVIDEIKTTYYKNN